MARLTCLLLGVVFVGIGVLVIARGADVNLYHNLLHVATGLVALGVGIGGSSSAPARRFCLGFGAFYLALGGVGMLLGDPATDRHWQIGPLSLDVADHLFHLVLGGVLLAVGVVTSRSLGWGGSAGRSGDRAPSRPSASRGAAGESPPASRR